MTEKAALPTMRTICIGRHLMALPTDLSLSGDVELVYGLDKNFRTVTVEVLRDKGNAPSFDALVAKQVGKLTASPNEDAPSKNMLAGWRKIDDDTVLIRANTEISEQGFFTALVIVQRGEAVGLIKADIFDHDKPENIEAKVLAVAKGISFVPDPEKAGKGTCLGPLLIDAGQDGERFTLGGRSTKYPELTAELSVDSLVAESDGGLLRRIEKNSGPMTKLGIFYHPVRKGRITLDGRDGEEFLDASKDDHDKMIHLFVAETLISKPSTFAAPSIDVQLHIGGQVPGGEYVDASFNEAQSLALWDAIIKSIRLRPGSV